MGVSKPGILKLMVVMLFVLPQSSVRKTGVVEAQKADRP